MHDNLSPFPPLHYVWNKMSRNLILEFKYEAEKIAGVSHRILYHRLGLLIVTKHRALCPQLLCRCTSSELYKKLASNYSI